ncbi:MAG: hypothetical protein ACREV5_08720 [Steroidobacter sp.]
MNGTLARAFAGVLAMFFVAMIERAASDKRRPAASPLTSCALALIFALGLTPTPAVAAGPLENGAVVRVSSGSIEAGWHRGRAVLDQRNCWMVKLDKPTQGGYTMLALSFVSSVEVDRSGAWAPLALQSLIKTQPEQCLEEGSD